ncbi:plastin-3-like [Liolophura sinensis]|uniref:plastin-3-like n=1 Tax=Liolophura sinensis TaxID=3198878 RepID=UPI0031590FC8
MADFDQKRQTLMIQQDDIQELAAAFASVDTNGSGFVELAELGDALKIVGMNLPGYEVRNLIRDFDKNCPDGKLDFEEFQKLYAKLKLEKDFAVNFKKMVHKRDNIETHSGMSEASSQGTTHTVRKEEQVAFSDWINSNLRDDPDCKKYIPFDPEGKDLFEKMKDGIILCKLVNLAQNDTIDERAINKTNLSVYRKHENLTLALNSAQSIGCNIVNIGADDLEKGKPHLSLGLLWQIIRIGLLSDIDLAHHPGLALLLEEGETLEDLQKLSPEQILLRWVNYHLRRAGCNKEVRNFTEDIKDSEAYTYLLHQIAPADSGVTLSPLQVGDHNMRAEEMLQEADKIGCRSFVSPSDVVSGNYKLNLAFVANLFNTYPALDNADVDVDIQQYEETREEKTYRNWMNSMGVQPFVHYLYSDLVDGLIIFQLYDIIKPGSVDWKKVIRKFHKMRINFEKLGNCNYAVELGKVMKFSLVGVGGQDILEGNQTLTLALVWQLMRAYTLSILQSLAGTGHPIVEKEIVDWANSKLKEGGKQSKFSSFQDPVLSDGRVIIDVVECLKPGSINFSLVKDGQTEEEKLSNAKYAISIARKIGARVYALPEDIVEVKPKMIMTIFACLMMKDLSA